MRHDAEPGHEEDSLAYSRRAGAESLCHPGRHDAFDHGPVDAALLEDIAFREDTGHASATTGPLPGVLPEGLPAVELAEEPRRILVQGLYHRGHVLAPERV